MHVAIGQQVADIMEANGQGWRIQSEYGYDTRMMFWRQRLIERLEKVINIKVQSCYLCWQKEIYFPRF